MKVSIVYWSGTGNTEAMANAVAEGAKNASKVRFRAKKWGCSALTIGATANGCALGSREWKLRAA